MKRATKELLLERATKNKEESKYKDYPCDALGSTLTIKRLPIAQVCDILDMAEGSTARENLDLYKELIYKSVPLFQDKDLSEAYDCIEPYDVVTAVFDDNLGAIGKLAEFIMDLYGMQDVVDDVKN